MSTEFEGNGSLPIASQRQYDVFPLYPCSVVLNILGLLSMIGNGLIIILHIQFPSLRNDQHLIPGLALADFMCGVGFVINAEIPLLPAETLTRLQCILLLFPIMFGLTAGPAYTFVISFMRYIGFSIPFLFARYRQPKYVVTLHALLLAYGCYPSVVSWVTEWSNLQGPLTICVGDTAMSETQTSVQLTISLFTVAGIIFANRSLWKAVKSQEASSSSASTRRDQRLATSLITVSVVYICTFCTTCVIYTLLFIFGDKETIIVYGQFSLIPTAINSSSNLFIYCWRTDEYTEALLYLFKRKDGSQPAGQPESKKSVPSIFRNRIGITATASSSKF